MALIPALFVAIIGAIILAVGLVLNGASSALSETENHAAIAVFWAGLVMLVAGAPLTYKFT